MLVHGIGGRGTVWAPVLAALARGHDVVAVDLPGHGGRSAPDGTSATVEGYAGRLEAFFAELGLERPHVAGNSTGGGVALELARRGSVRSATAISPIGFWSRAELAYARGSLRATRAVAGRPRVHRAMKSAAVRGLTLRQGFGRPGRVPADAAREVLAALAGSGAFEATLENFSDHVFARGEELRPTPVTVAWGTRDLLLPCALQAPRARRALPWARHVILPGCGHVPFWDDPARCAAEIAAGAGAG